VIYHGEFQQRTHVVGHQYQVEAQYNHREIHTKEPFDDVTEKELFKLPAYVA
jgi:hypothetical protein